MSQDFKMINDHAVGEFSADIIFEIAGKAAQAAQKIGSENVINASIGSLTDDKGGLMTNSVYYDVLRSLSNAEMAGYSAMQGEPGFLNASIKACFRDVKPDGYVEAVTTMGGTAAVRNVIWNYANDGDEVLVTDWNWSPYNIIAYENKRKMKEFKMFTDDHQFNIAALEEATVELMKKQDCVIAIINVPAHNPTGYTMSYKEAQELYAMYEVLAQKNPLKRFVILFDVAYIDFAGEKGRDFIRAYKTLPKNVLLLFSYSLSKTATAYGLRTASLISLSGDKEIALEAKAAGTFSTRGVYTGCVSAAQRAFAKVYEDEALTEKFEAERETHVQLVGRRASALMREADKIGLKYMPFDSGYFMSIPILGEAMPVVEAMFEKNAFTVPMPQGIRIAVCSVPEDKCARLPAILKEYVQQ